MVGDQNTGIEGLLQVLRDMYEEKLPFNKVLGLQVAVLNIEQSCLKFEMKEEFIGNYVHGILHGGVISAVLDTTGGLTASVGLVHKLEGRSRNVIKEGLARVGTIDLRVDYLRPGRGKYFHATGSIMRAGRKVTVTRMELHNDQDVLIAVGTGTYIVG